MRLTLRTLMAWMDDTLPPKDVRRIGRQLERSKFSQDLSHRIRQVVRRRRLTVPGMGTNQPVDANVVAAYLDNNLPPEVTSGFESLCLNSDVHLAEVAACHQILSVLDQPSPIPAETYSAMYRVVKAAEARIQADRIPPQPVPAPAPARFAADSARSEEPPWPAPPFVKNLPRFVAASLVFCGLLAFGGIALDRIVGPRPLAAPVLIAADEPTIPVDIVPPAPEEPAGLEQPPAPPVEAMPPAAVANPAPATAESKPAVAETKKETEPPAPAEPEKKAVAEVAKAAMPDSKPSVAPAKPADEPPPVARMSNAEAGETIGLAGLATIADSTILLTAPATTTGPGTWSLWKKEPATPCFVRVAGARSIRVDSDSLELFVGPGTLLELADDSAAKWVLGQGEAKAKTAGKLRIRNEIGRELTISYPAGARFAIRSVPAGRDTAGKPLQKLEVLALENPLTVSLGRSEQKLEEGQILKVEAQGNGQEIVKATPIATGTVESKRSSAAAASLVTSMMRRYLSTNRPISTSIVDAQADELPDVRDLAMKIALWIGRDDIVTGVLTDLDTAKLRDSAIFAYREVLARGEPNTGRIMEAVTDELALNIPDAELLASLLAGTAADEDLEGKKRLVIALEHDARLVRQLALERLMKISGRDSMGYDPDSPTEKGLDAWKMWIGMASQDPRP